MDEAPADDAASVALEAAEVKITFHTEASFGLHQMVSLIAGVIRETQTFNWAKRSLLAAIRHRVLMVGLNNAAAWDFGLESRDAARFSDVAVGLAYRHWREELFPGEDRPAPETYTVRLQKWKNTLDDEQMSRYTRGKFKAFGETGRGRKTRPAAAESDGKG